MANLTCFNVLQVCHLRVLRLAGDGTVAVSPEARYEHTAPILFGYTPQAPDRETFEQLNGCGDECAYFIAPPKAVRSAELSLELCQQDAELLELLMGGSLITDGDDTIGYQSSVDATVNENGVAIETWSKAWNRRQRAIVNGSPGFYRHVFAKTQWTQDETTNDNSGFTTITLTGTGEVNSGFALGFEDDPQPAALGESVYQWYTTGAIPDGACGYQPVPAAS